MVYCRAQLVICRVYNVVSTFLVILYNCLYRLLLTNQSIENTGLAFVKEVNERNEKINKTVMYDEQVRTNKFKDYTLRDELIWG